MVPVNGERVDMPVRIFMFEIRKTAAAAVVAVTFAGITAPMAVAQLTDTGASTPKEVRKAQRKAARSKKNAELSTLEKNGYQPGGDQTNYPQNIQNAEKKAAASKAASTP
jgi:hypothetical protein